MTAATPFGSPLTIWIDVKIAGRTWTKKKVIENPNAAGNGARAYATVAEGVRYRWRSYRDGAEAATRFLNAVGISAEIRVRPLDHESIEVAS